MNRKVVAAAVGAVVVLATLIILFVAPALSAQTADPACGVAGGGFTGGDQNGTGASGLAVHALDDANGTNESVDQDDGGCAASQADVNSGSNGSLATNAIALPSGLPLTLGSSGTPSAALAWAGVQGEIVVGSLLGHAATGPGVGSGP